VFLFPAGQMFPSPLNLQTNSGAHGVLCIVGVRQPERVADKLPDLVPRIIRHIAIPQFPISFHGLQMNNFSTLKMEALCSSEMSIFTQYRTL